MALEFRLQLLGLLWPGLVVALDRLVEGPLAAQEDRVAAGTVAQFRLAAMGQQTKVRAVAAGIISTKVEMEAQGVALVDITITLEPFMEELQLQVKEMLEEIVQLLTTLVVVVELEELVLVLQRFLMEE